MSTKDGVLVFCRCGPCRHFTPRLAKVGATSMLAIVLHPLHGPAVAYEFSLPLSGVCQD